MPLDIGHSCIGASTVVCLISGLVENVESVPGPWQVVWVGPAAGVGSGVGIGGSYGEWECMEGEEG